MPLIKSVTQSVFDTEEIQPGYLIYAKYQTWENGRQGFVTEVSGSEVTVQYFPDIGTITNHFIIRISEILQGKWCIRWSKDMQVIHVMAEGEEV